MTPQAAMLSAAQIRARTGARAPRDETPEMRRTVSLAVRCAKEGDSDALRFLYVRYAGNVREYVRSVIHDEYEAEDITQVVFAKLMTAIVKYDERAVPFLGWLLRVAHNAAIDQMRGIRAAPVPEVHGSNDDPGSDITDEISGCKESLTAALATLPVEQRNVVLLRHVFGFSPSEIAETLGRTESSVHGLHHRGRRALQDELTRLHTGPATSCAVG